MSGRRGGHPPAMTRSDCLESTRTHRRYGWTKWRRRLSRSHDRRRSRRPHPDLRRRDLPDIPSGDILSVAFVATSYCTLLLLFSSLRAYERTPPADAAGRERIRRRVWCLCTALTAMFAWKVAGVMPPAAAAAIWLLAAATSIGGFVVLFHHRP
uniref:Uncharacterized protein n=1 Tax=Leersia perrieri TaxID=77586 RepID=A0A0D9WLS2_9ORYZ